MENSDQSVFPFAEFDPLLRRDLCAALETVQRALGIADENTPDADYKTEAQSRMDAHLKSCAIARLRALAEDGERSLERLHEETVRTVSEEAARTD